MSDPAEPTLEEYRYAMSPVRVSARAVSQRHRPAVVNPILNTIMLSVTQRFVEAAPAEHDSGTRPCLSTDTPGRNNAYEKHKQQNPSGF
jgi:hypothetical protein